MISAWAAIMLVAAQPVAAETPPAPAPTAEAVPGSSKETAIRVASVAREYEYLKKLGFHVSRQSLVIGERGRAYDVIAAKNAETGEEREFWFDISSFYGREFSF